MKRLLFVLFVLLTCAAPVLAQVAVPSVPANVNVLVLPATGPVDTVAFIANLMTAISATSPNCNQPPLPPPVGTLVNPTTVEFDDPFRPVVLPAVQQKCRAPVPVGLPAGTAYRIVAVFHDSTGAFGLRSAVGAPPFDILSIQGPPVAPKTVGVRP